MKNILKSNKGASEIVGALLLIAVVIVAVSGIAVIVAQVQKNEMERQSNIDAVEKENIKIMSILPVLNGTTGYLDALNITITNLNAVDSRVANVIINDKAAVNYTSSNEYNEEKNYSYTDRLNVPAGKAKVLSINFSTNYDPNPNVSSQKALKVSVLTENGNMFSKMYMPPTPIIKTSIETENLGVAERDLLVLDGSESYDDGSIVSYEWNICAEETTTTTSTSFGATTTTTSTTTTTTSLGATTTTTTSSTTSTTCFYTASGKKVRAYLSSTGPFYVTLNVTDDTNMIGISEPIKIPEDKNFNPPVRLDASFSSPILTANVKDSYGSGVYGSAVIFYRLSGDASLSAWSGTTNNNGEVSANLNSGSGVIEVRSGQMNPVDIQVTTTPTTTTTTTTI